MRVTFWNEDGSAGALIEQDGERVCCVTRYSSDQIGSASTLTAAALDADLLIFAGDWQDGLALKKSANAKLLALAGSRPERDPFPAAEAATQKSANVFFVQRKMWLDL